MNLDISGSVAKTQWISDVSVPESLSFYISLNVYGDDFISLAPDWEGDLSVVLVCFNKSTASVCRYKRTCFQWNLNGTSKVLAELDDAYTTPYFGPIIEYITPDQSAYLALCVYDSDIDSDLDRWAVAKVDLPSMRTIAMLLKTGVNLIHQLNNRWQLSRVGAVAVGFGTSDLCLWHWSTCELAFFFVNMLYCMPVSGCCVNTRPKGKGQIPKICLQRNHNSWTKPNNPFHCSPKQWHCST
jgi:hypothetical protein